MALYLVALPGGPLPGGSTWWPPLPGGPHLVALYLVAPYLVALPGGPTWWPSTWWLYLVALTWWLYLVALPGGPLPGGGLLRFFS